MNTVKGVVVLMASALVEVAMCAPCAYYLPGVKIESIFGLNDSNLTAVATIGKSKRATIKLEQPLGPIDELTISTLHRVHTPCGMGSGNSRGVANDVEAGTNRTSHVELIFGRKELDAACSDAEAYEQYCRLIADVAKYLNVELPKPTAISGAVNRETLCTTAISVGRGFAHVAMDFTLSLPIVFKDEDKIVYVRPAYVRMWIRPHQLIPRYVDMQKTTFDTAATVRFGENLFSKFVAAPESSLVEPQDETVKEYYINYLGDVLEQLKRARLDRDDKLVKCKKTDYIIREYVGLLVADDGEAYFFDYGLKNRDSPEMVMAVEFAKRDFYNVPSKDMVFVGLHEEYFAAEAKCRSLMMLRDKILKMAKGEGACIR